MIATEGRVVVYYMGFLQPKTFCEQVIFGRPYLKIALMQSRGATLARCLHGICILTMPLYIPLSPPVPSPGGGLILWIVTQLRLGGTIILLWLLIISKNGKRICPLSNPMVKYMHILYSTRLSPSSEFQGNLSMTMEGTFRNK